MSATVSQMEERKIRLWKPDDLRGPAVAAAGAAVIFYFDENDCFVLTGVKDPEHKRRPNPQRIYTSGDFVHPDDVTVENTILRAVREDFPEFEGVVNPLIDYNLIVLGPHTGIIQNDEFGAVGVPYATTYYTVEATNREVIHSHHEDVRVEWKSSIKDLFDLNELLPVYLGLHPWRPSGNVIPEVPFTSDGLPYRFTADHRVEVLITQRSMTTKYGPGKWMTTAGGFLNPPWSKNPDYSVYEGYDREMFEELGRHLRVTRAIQPFAVYGPQKRNWTWSEFQQQPLPTRDTDQDLPVVTAVHFVLCEGGEFEETEEVINGEWLPTDAALRDPRPWFINHLQHLWDAEQIGYPTRKDLLQS